MTDFNKLIPLKILFNFREIEEIGLIKMDMMKKLSDKREIEIVTIGAKRHVSRDELLRYLNENTRKLANDN